MCKDVGPGSFFPQNEPQTTHDTPQAFINQQLRIEVPFSRQPEPHTAKVLSKNDPVIFEMKCTDKRCRDKKPEAVASGKIVRGSGLWIPVQVEKQLCRAMVDTCASRSLMRLRIASEMENPILPYYHNIFGPIGNVIPVH